MGVSTILQSSHVNVERERGGGKGGRINMGVSTMLQISRLNVSPSQIAPW